MVSFPIIQLCCCNESSHKYVNDWLCSNKTTKTGSWMEVASGDVADLPLWLLFSLGNTFFPLTLLSGQFEGRGKGEAEEN